MARNGRRARVGALAAVLVGLTAGAGVGQDGRAAPGDWGAVYALTNDPDGNELAVYTRDGRGRLAPPVFVPTGGDGTGTGLGNQGALALSPDRQYLYAVNPGSDTVTVFRMNDRGPQVLQVVGAGGRRPVAVAAHTGRVYVLNAGGAVGGEDCVTGFEVRPNGRLRPLDGSRQLLSARNTAPAQVGFNPGGDVLVVTEKATDTLAAFALDPQGVPEGRRFTKSAGRTPFGFEFTRRGHLIVSEAFGGEPNASAVSSYAVDAEEGGVTVVSKPVPTLQTAACWIATTRDGGLAYTTNTGSDTVTGYRVGRTGVLTRVTENGVTAKTGKAPTDAAVFGNRTLFVLNRDDGTIGVYGITAGGGLEPVQTVGGLPKTTRPTGLVVR